MSTTFSPDYLARGAEQLGWDDTPAGQQKRQEDLALLQELMVATARAHSAASRSTGLRISGAPDRHPQGG
jgi:hypothetical protein